MAWTGRVKRREQVRNRYKFLVQKSKDQTPFYKLRHKLEDNIKIDIKKGFRGC
jgi:hypothetical protein